jgi:uncharacterized protein
MRVEGPLIRQAVRQPTPTGFHIMTKPIGPICNLDCRYCFYLEKEELYTAERQRRPSWEMPPDVLETYIRQYIQNQEIPEISFAWQGGEPTLLGVRFFERVVQLQARYAEGKRIHNALQTNGTLLDDAWCEFLARNGFLVGLSIDGPEDLHDAYRVDKRGRPTYAAVERGLNLLKKHGVEFNTLTVLHRLNAREPERVYSFLKEIGSGYMQFIPLVERSAAAPLQTEGGLIRLSLAAPPGSTQTESPVTEWSVIPEDYGEFLCRVFDAWVRRDVGRVFVQAFDVALGIWAGYGASLCVFAETCGDALALEHNGDLYACDHYVYPEYLRGNILRSSLTELARSPAQRKFGADKRDTLPRYCRACEVRFACNGECPKHRFLRTPDGEYGLNYLCAGYKRFFSHIDAPMRTMAQLLHAGRAPAEIMEILAGRAARPRSAVAVGAARAPGRNDACPCGSGRKYKHCCLGRAASP